MSADNWAICPRCRADRAAAADAAHAAVTAAYGTVDVAEFDRLRDQANQLTEQIDSEKGRTFREDYEVYGACDGEVVIGYSGSCNRCGLSLSVEHRHPLEVDR